MTDFISPPPERPLASDFLMMAGDLSIVPNRKKITQDEALAAREAEERANHRRDFIEGFSSVPPTPGIFS